MSDYTTIESANYREPGSKRCSICGNWYIPGRFSNGNRRTNRSYCTSCNTEEKAAYKRGGRDEARRYREEARASRRLP